MTARRVLLAVLLSAAFPLAGLQPADAGAPGRIEVVEVAGIVDGSVERTVTAVIEDAERDGAALVVLQIDSSGSLETDRTLRLARRIRDATVPVASWVGGPGTGRAAHGAVLLALAADVRSMAPGTRLGPLDTLDLRAAAPDPDGAQRVLDELVEHAYPAHAYSGGVIGPNAALEAGVVDHVVPSISDLIRDADGTEVGAVALDLDPERAEVRFHKLDLFGRAMHAAAQPSIAYLLLLLGLVGVVFELFHPSTGPAGVAGLAGLALGTFGVVTLGGSWMALVLIVAGVAGFAIDLRYQSLGVFTLLGFAGLVAGSLLLFRGPWLQLSAWILLIGIAGMVLFLLGAMTRVLRDLRAVARGELEVTDAHAHLHDEAHTNDGS